MMICRRASHSWWAQAAAQGVNPRSSYRLPPRQTLGEHAGPISALDFTEPYGTLVTAGQDDIVRVWDLCDGQQVGTLRGHTGGSGRMSIAESQLTMFGNGQAPSRLSR